MPFLTYMTRKPPPYVLHSMLAAIGGLLFGLDTGTIGPLTTMAQFDSYFGKLSPTIHGLLVSSILIPASVTSFFAGTVADRLGRVGTIFVGGFLFSLGTALEAAAQNLAMLFVGRCVTGVGEGLFLSTLIVYIIEISPPHQRGVLASIPQFLTTFGICVGYFVCYGTVNVEGSSLSWRLPWALISFIAVFYGALVFFFLPQSPRWLKSKGRFEEAALAWERLGIPSVEAEKEDDSQGQDQKPADGSEHHHSFHPEPLTYPDPESHALAPMHSRTSVPGAPTSSDSWLRVFHRDVRSRTLLAAFILGMQQLSGIDGVLYYAPLLFQQAGLSSSQASFLASGVSALLMMLITIPGFLYADAWGRRTSTIYGGLGITACMLIIGSLYASGAVHTDYGAARWVVVVLIYVFALTFSATWALHMRVYASEVQPLRTRAPATSLALTSNWCVNFLVALTTPIILAHTSYGLYFLFGGSTLLTVVVCAVKMPETRGRSLEEIDEAFSKGSLSGKMGHEGGTEKVIRRASAKEPAVTASSKDCEV